MQSDGKGVTIPSQQRYIGYYEEILRDEGGIRERELMLDSVIMFTVPKFDVGGGVNISLSLSLLFVLFFVYCRSWSATAGCDPYCVVKVAGEEVFTSEVLKHKKKEDSVEIPVGVRVASDCKVILWDHDRTSSDDKMAWAWFHPAYIEGNELELPLQKVDGAVKVSGLICFLSES